ncbi:SH3 domain-containing protein [Pararhizobium sp.]|uniref:SH3 domain-containing protein n=1 Tax=Pararhizobium sp. TaxID=1977563 RepID=UPI002728DF72|nr:SH3 domain-containing protein [Pararhizobium sp.]MDO9414882.1 SH3 domain-containing protein [Pararhizobium sp.]
MKMLILTSLVALTIASQAEAGYDRCRVADPTGTPLNVRVQPAGDIVGSLDNSMPVNRAERVRDGQGKVWAFVQNPKNGHPIGWVFSDYLHCF